MKKDETRGEQRNGERDRREERERGAEEKEKNILEGDEMQMYSLHSEVKRAKVCRRSVSISDR